ncbi:E3 ubiquitin-protein ligase TRIM4-like [Antechinus flavipes]|uniref:E3 ubiquitin-protein ligase TRIM4-like n=1 Tax=Antechinus flavipes TaxID=38775 RepID=UPI0022368303|nr:E3 ubiquitin-protein ligase TRIM4-like [Antechinus flavipes]
MAHVENKQKEQEQGAEKTGLVRRLEKDPQFDKGAMNARRLNDGFQNLLTCPVCSNCFHDPVTVFSGNTICRNCVPHGFPNACVNWRMKSVVNLFHLLKPRLAELPVVSEPRCPEHGEPFTLLCLEDNQRICQVCKFSSLHRSHTLSQILEPDQ